MLMINNDPRMAVINHFYKIFEIFLISFLMIDWINFVDNNVGIISQTKFW